MSLRIGVIAAPGSINAGGWWTLPTVLSQTLKQARTRHEFVFIGEGARPQSLADAKSTVWRDIGHRMLRAPYGRCVNLMRRAVPRDVREAVATFRGRNDRSHLEAEAVQKKIDIVWFLTPHGLPLDVPYIATVWDLEHRKQPYFPEVSVTGWTWTDRERGYRTTLPRASVVITGTEVGKQEVVHYYGVNPENVKVIQFPVPSPDLQRTAVDLQHLQNKYRINGPFLFYPAQYWPHKNHVNLLMALDHLRNRSGLRLNLVFTGSDKGNRQYVQERIHEWGLSDQVFDLGFVSREELNALYMNALALVYPTFFGPDNLPPLEAFALKCPVLASRIPGAEEQLGAGALLFDPADPVDIADKILKLSSASSLRQSLTEAGTMIARVRTPERYIAQIEEALDAFEARRRCWGRDYRDA
jgi:glycosyltransferase involved in cell wall biosynthesis